MTCNVGLTTANTSALLNLNYICTHQLVVPTLILPVQNNPEKTQPEDKR